MAFNSLVFILFFIVFYLLYWFVFNKSLKFQNQLLLTGSYFFYSWWDWRFLFLLTGSSVLNYFLGICISRSKSEDRKTLLIGLGLLQNLGILFLFKYFNFFIESLTDAFELINLNLNFSSLKLILPLGISFYTFRAISYLLDVYNDKIEPTKDWVVFFTYMAFFPSLISGPIDRPSALIPQLENNRKFEYDKAVDGMRQILWGLFKKIVVADNCATLTNQIFDISQEWPASSLILGAFFYTIQVYADFSGYSDMAIGLSRLIGFNISQNFNYPFFAQNIAEYWQRWHISLTSWMTDYVFTPLNFILRTSGKFGIIAAIIINFLLVGVWHGANWTFLLFGLLNGCYFIPLVLHGNSKKSKKVNTKNLPSFIELKNIIFTFILVMLTNVIFRANTVAEAFNYYKTIFSMSLFSIPRIPDSKTNVLFILIFIAILFSVEWFQRDRQHGLQLEKIQKPAARMTIYYGLIFSILIFGATDSNQFIYFKF